MTKLKLLVLGVTVYLQPGVSRIEVVGIDR